MNYLYYPGCSLGSTGRAYDESARFVFQTLGSPLTEMDDWNCCGATAYMSISELHAAALSARNLAKAEKQSSNGPTDLVAPCAACYLGLVKAQHLLDDSAEVRGKVNSALTAAGLSYQGTVRVRHPLDVLAHDIGPEKIAKATTRSLKGIRIACYYGCQIVRPYATFDDQFRPTTMDTVLKAAGAEIVDWPLRTRCCGASLTGTIQEVGLRMSYVLVREAKKRKADLIATACPLCQFNLECFQGKMRSLYADDVSIPVAYFTQILGLALGGTRKQLGLKRLFVPVEPILARSSAAPAGSK